MPATKRKRRGLSWEPQRDDGSVALRGDAGGRPGAASRLEIATSDGGKLQVSPRERRPGTVYIDVRGAIEVQPRKGRFYLTLLDDHRTRPSRGSASPKARGGRG